MKNGRFVCCHGDIEYFWNNLLHREDGPAIEKIDGTLNWCQNGLYHREDGPAVVNKYGRQWYKHGKVHREDGPAVEYVDGTCEFWLNGIEYSLENWLERVDISTEEKVMFKLRYG